MESKNRNSTETEKVLRKQFVKQQIKEREDHMKDLRAKDREIEKLKKKLDEVRIIKKRISFNCIALSLPFGWYIFRLFEHLKCSFS